jgi:hypothetical protein
MATERTVALIALRLAAAGTAVAMGAIHLHLWYDGYRYLDTIGTLFLLNAIGGFVLAVALLATPGRFLAVVSALGALYAVSVLGALSMSLTVGLFGFEESIDTELVVTTLAINSIAVLVLGVLTAIQLRERRSRG